VYALDAASGALRWKFHTGNVVHASPAVAAGTLYVGSWDSYFYALDAATRQAALAIQDRRGSRDPQPGGHPVLGRGGGRMVYFGCRDSNLYALDAASGAHAGRSPQGIVGDQLTGGARRQAVLRNLRQRLVHRSMPGAAARYFPGLQALAVLLLADARRGLSVHRLAPGQAPGDQPEDAPARVELRDRGRAKNGPTYTKADGTPNYRAAAGDSFYDQMVIGLDRMMSVGAVLSTP